VEDGGAGEQAEAQEAEGAGGDGQGDSAARRRERNRRRRRNRRRGQRDGAAPAMVQEGEATASPEGGEPSPAGDGDGAPRKRSRNRRRGRKKRTGQGAEEGLEATAPVVAPVAPPRQERQRRQRGQNWRQGRRQPPPVFAQTWWSERWTAMLNNFGWKARVARGAEYASQGAVRDLDMDEYGQVYANVYGSRPEPYAVTLALVHLADEEWDRVLAEMSNNLLLAATLLNGEMPRDIEEPFFQAGVTLFPYEGQEILTECSCPDQVNPCKHIAAVFFHMAVEFDRDPFLIFRLRGRSAEQVQAALRALRAEAEQVEDEDLPNPELEARRLDEGLEGFWKAGDGIDRFRVSIEPPVTPGAVLLRLGQPQGWDGARGFIFTMAGYYEALSSRALQTAYSEGSQANPAAP
jgi:uncharacterized Zn finger protein